MHVFCVEMGQGEKREDIIYCMCFEFKMVKRGKQNIIFQCMGSELKRGLDDIFESMWSVVE